MRNFLIDLRREARKELLTPFMCFCYGFLLCWGLEVLARLLARL